jgi:hypothetical protein
VPTDMIKKDAREGKGTVKSLEKDWDEAKDAAGKKNGKQQWALTNYVYQKEKNAHASVTATLRLLATSEVSADAFEGWVNSLQYDYERPEGADYIILNAPLSEVEDKLRADGWVIEDLYATKGEHAVTLKGMNGKTRVRDVK